MESSCEEFFKVWPELRSELFTPGDYEAIYSQNAVLVIDGPGKCKKIHRGFESVEAAQKFIAIRGDGTILTRANLFSRETIPPLTGFWTDHFLSLFQYLHPEILARVAEQYRCLGKTRPEIMSELATEYAWALLGDKQRVFTSVVNVFGELWLEKNCSEGKLASIPTPETVSINGKEYRVETDLNGFDIFHAIYSVVKPHSRPNHTKCRQILYLLLADPISEPFIKGSLARYLTESGDE